MITSGQCRAARAFLNLSREGLAEMASVAARTISDFESDRREPIRSTAQAIVRAFEAAGIRFTEHGVEYPPPRRLGPGATLLSGITTEEQDARQRAWEAATGKAKP